MPLAKEYIEEVMNNTRLINILYLNVLYGEPKSILSIQLLLLNNF